MMKRVWLLLLAGGSSALAAGCGGEVNRYDRDPVAPVVPPMPPEHVMRRYPDFRFSDYATGKEYILRLYSDENGKDELVTVRDPGQAERAATLGEREFALSVFATDWKLRGDEERLQYHNDLLRNERQRSSTLLDHQIQLEQAGLDRWRERYDTVLFNLRARKETGVHPKDGDELSTKFHEPKTEFLEQELARLELEIKAVEARLKMLVYKKTLRDGAYSRSTVAYFVRDAIQVNDIAKAIPVDQIIARIKNDIEPASWKRAQAVIEVQGDFIVVTQLPEVLDRVRAYVEDLRIEARRAPK